MTPRRATLELADLTASNATLRIAGLTASASNTVETLAELASTNWLPLHQFESWASTADYPVALDGAGAFYRVRSE